MTIARISRRAAVAGAAALAMTRPAWAEDDPPASPLAHGALAKNPVALAFVDPPAPAVLPDVMVMTLDGDRPLADFVKGKTVLMPLWAEWCAPCLGEIPDFAQLQRRHGNANFAIVPVLTAARKQVTPQVLTTIFADLRASNFAPLVEQTFGRRLFRTMTMRPRTGWELPCNIVIAPSGKVVAREFGMDTSQEGLTHSNIVQRAEGGGSLSLWGQPPGDEFAAALANGFLNGV